MDTLKYYKVLTKLQDDEGAIELFPIFASFDEKQDALFSIQMYTKIKFVFNKDYIVECTKEEILNSAEHVDKIVYFINMGKYYSVNSKQNIHNIFSSGNMDDLEKDAIIYKLSGLKG